MNGRLLYINNLAEKLREILEMGYPADVKKAIIDLGGHIDSAALDLAGADAKIEADNTGKKEFKVTLNSKVSSSDNRMRFTLAHELGHLFLHMGYMIDQEKWDKFKTGDNSELGYIDGAYYRSGYSEEEREANEFAGAFLMPRSEFYRVADENLKEGVYSIAPVAKHFGVSIDAAKMRGRYLNLFSWET